MYISNHDPYDNVHNLKGYTRGITINYHVYTMLSLSNFPNNTNIYILCILPNTDPIKAIDRHRTAMELSLGGENGTEKPKKSRAKSSIRDWRDASDSNAGNIGYERNKSLYMSVYANKSQSTHSVHKLNEIKRAWSSS